MWHRAQGVRYRGSKFYYNQHKNAPRMHQEMETFFKNGFTEDTEYLEITRDIRPTHHFYDDGRRIPELHFAEDAIRDYWIQRFGQDHKLHAFSFIGRDKDYYTHPRDVWVNRQVHAMKKYNLNFREGYDYMERAHQRDLYVSKLERQHQLQQLQEQGMSTAFQRTYQENVLSDQITTRQLTQLERYRQFQTQMIREAAQINATLAERGQPFEKISVFGHSGEFTDQKLVVQFIQENPEFLHCFDSSWFVLEMNALRWMEVHEVGTWTELRTMFHEAEKKMEVLDKDPRIGDYYITERLAEAIEALESRVLPGHPNKYPVLLWEEQRRHIRYKDEEFAKTMAVAGNTSALEYQHQAVSTRTKAKATLEQMMQSFNAAIGDKVSQPAE